MGGCLNVDNDCFYCMESLPKQCDFSLSYAHKHTWSIIMLTVTIIRHANQQPTCSRKLGNEQTNVCETTMMIITKQQFFGNKRNVKQHQLEHPTTQAKQYVCANGVRVQWELTLPEMEWNQGTNVSSIERCATDVRRAFRTISLHCTESSGGGKWLYGHFNCFT